MLASEIELNSNFTVLSGSAFGINCSSLTFSIVLDLAEEINFSPLDAYVQEIIPHEHAPYLSPESNELALLHRLTYWAAEIQRQSNIPSHDGFYVRSRTELPDQRVSLEVCFPAIKPRAAGRSLAWAFYTSRRFLAQTSLEDWDTTVSRDRYKKLFEFLKQFREAGINSYHICQAAIRLNIPYASVGEKIMILGTGNRLKLMQSTKTTETSAIAIGIARDKLLTAKLLGMAGLPGAIQTLVANPKEALSAAEKLGYPVVVKPANLDNGQGVASNLKNPESVREAFKSARQLSSKILVEKHFDGDGHRMTVFRGELLKVNKRIPGGVTGDGVHSIAELVDLRTNDPESRRRLYSYGKISLDGEALSLLSSANMSVDHIPADGEFVCLRRRNNVSAGGTNEQIDLATVHPDNVKLAKQVARCLNLDFAGVDLLISDITKSWLEVGGLVCEVNGTPQFHPGKMPDIYLDILKEYMGENVRVPAYLYISSKSDIEVSLGGFDSAMEERKCNALASPFSLSVDGQKLSSAPKRGWEAAKQALANCDTSGVLIALSPDEILKLGLPTDQFVEIQINEEKCWEGEEDRIQNIANLKAMVSPHAETVLSV